MTRGLKQAWRWRTAFWLRESPGIVPGGVFLALPLVFFLPLEKLSIFGERWRGVAILIWLLALALALTLRSRASLRDETSLWTVQKGLSLGELALEDWILDIGLLAAANLWWAFMGFLALRTTGTPAFGPALGLFAMGLATGLVAHTVTLFLSALGADRPSDPTVLLAFVSILVPVVALEVPPWTTEVLDWIIPPFHSAIVLSGTVRIGDLAGMSVALIHILLYSGMMLALGLWRLSAWRPKA